LKKKLTDPKETATRKRVDAILNNLRWKTDESSSDCNVYTERAKTTTQNRALKGAEPDYVLYQSGTDTPIAVIEAKRSGQSLAKALEQARDLYARPLGVPIVFVADGAIIEARDSRSGELLRLDEELVTTLLSEKLLLRFVAEGPNLFTPVAVRHTKQELIRVFGEANELLRKEGLREGIERFTEFSNLLFLKLISEIEADREQNGEPRILEKKYCWDAFSRKPGPEMLDYINDTILPRLVNRYNHSGDVFQKKLLIATPETLKEIVDKLSELTLNDADSDVKGDAFEYFLKNSVSVGNDLGEYFTPRHIVKLIVDLVDPRYRDTVYDPACGTGGFLIQAFRHIQAKVRPTKAATKFLKEHTVYGRELTGTAKIAKMNMIIIGDGHTNIEQRDSLKSPIKNKFNVVLTNYPFSQETDFASYYGLTGESANPVFLKHVIDALKSDGQAGVVVPEGLLFDESSQAEKVRRLLLETCDVYAVINLHTFVFRPYTGQPTSILVFRKGKQTKRVWFFEVREDGFEKSQRKHGRRPIPANDLPLLRRLWTDREDSEQSFSVDFDTIREHGYKLTMDEYRQASVGADWVPLGGEDGICDIIIGGTPDTRRRDYYGGSFPWVKIGDITGAVGGVVTQTADKLTAAGVADSNVKLIPKGTVLISFKLSVGKVAIAGTDLYTNEAIAALIPKDKRVLPKYLYYLLPRISLTGGRKAAKGNTSSKARLAAARIPLPSIAKQRDFIRDMEHIEVAIAKYEAAIVKAQVRERELVHPYVSV
jgi:type I restriction enzyme M protein